MSGEFYFGTLEKFHPALTFEPWPPSIAGCRGAEQRLSKWRRGQRKATPNDI